MSFVAAASDDGPGINVVTARSQRQRLCNCGLMMLRGALVGLVLAASLAGCSPSAECLCLAASVDNAPTTAAPGAALTLQLVNLYGPCSCNPPVPDEVTVQLTDNNGEVLDEETVDVADDATASVTLDMPNTAPTYVTVEIDGYDAAGFWVKEAD